MSDSRAEKWESSRSERQNKEVTKEEGNLGK